MFEFIRKVVLQKADIKNSIEDCYFLGREKTGTIVRLPTPAMISDSEISSSNTWSSEKIDGVIADTISAGCPSCEETVIWDQISTSGIPLQTNPTLSTTEELSGSDCFYYEFNITGTWSKHSVDNDEGIDFTAEPIILKTFIKVGSGTWQMIDSAEFNAGVGDVINVSRKLLLSLDSYNNTKIAVGYYTGSNWRVIPIQNHSRFFLQLAAKKCLRTSFSRDYSWGSTIKTSDSIYNYQTGKLPFAGRYLVSAIVSGSEYKIDTITRENTQSSQEMSISNGNTDDDKTLDVSGFYTPTTGSGITAGAWYNGSLQGTATMETTEPEREFTITVTLPNGIVKQINFAYITVKYLGKTIHNDSAEPNNMEWN